MKILWDSWENKAKLNDGLPDTIPDSLLNADWALRIHGQTLERLNERGGLSLAEIVVNVKKLSYREFDKITVTDAVKFVKELLSQKPC